MTAIKGEGRPRSVVMIAAAGKAGSFRGLRGEGERQGGGQ